MTGDETRPRRLRVMADYYSYPLWLPGESDNVSPTDPRLGISPGLSERLNEWAAEYDGILCMEDPASSGFESPEAEWRFGETGEALARAVAQELGGGWDVTYFDTRTGADRDIPYVSHER
ncbi:hypothetical protein [Streptomyces sp. NPDC047024]|uniref:hypothetical protein n=1 Tax=Streptomyces sp. NPDC047024 TaxID=3155476 RepID=UPI00340E7CB4